MWTTIKDTLEEKHFVMAILTMLAAVAAHFGLDLDTTTILVCITPMFVAIGAHGWGAGAATTLASSTAPPAAQAPAPTAAASSAPKGFVKLGLVLVLALIGLNVASIVGCSSSSRGTAINTAYSTTLAVGSAFEAFDGAHEQDLVAQAPTRAAADASLASWQAKRTKIELAIKVALQTEVACALANDSTSLATMTSAVAQLVAEAKADGVPIP